MNRVVTKNNDEVINDLFNQIEGIIVNGRNKAFYQVNSILVNTYFNIGKIIVENEQNEAKYDKK